MRYIKCRAASRRREATSAATAAPSHSEAALIVAAAWRWQTHRQAQWPDAAKKPETSPAIARVGLLPDETSHHRASKSASRDRRRARRAPRRSPYLILPALTASGRTAKAVGRARRPNELANQHRSNHDQRQRIGAAAAAPGMAAIRRATWRQQPIEPNVNPVIDDDGNGEGRRCGRGSRQPQAWRRADSILRLISARRQCRRDHP